MKQIAQFFTLFWIIYFPTCIAYNDLPGFSSVDELMTFILIGYTWMKKGNRALNPEPWREFKQFLWILTFYIVYSLIMAVNVADSVFLEFLQQIRPYSVIYCTWILNPRFSENQKKWMLRVMVLTLFSWIAYHPESATQKDAEFPVLGQLAICTGMSWYLFTDESRKNRNIALFLVFTGMLAPKFKFLGEIICFIALLFYVKRQLNFKSSKTIVSICALVTVIIISTWSRFDMYYVSGFQEETESQKARPKTYKTSLYILRDYVPFGPGMGTFASNGAAKNYSPLYYKYKLDQTWGLDPGSASSGFIADAFYPSLAQYGIVGVWLFFIFWKRRFLVMKDIENMRYYRVTLMAFLCLAIEQTSDSSFLSGKGMGYCMLIGLGMNANRNMLVEDKEREENIGYRIIKYHTAMGMRNRRE